MKNNCAFTKPGQVFVLVALLTLAGCASNSPAPVSGGGGQPTAAAVSAAKDTYTVRSGDTLYSIAREHNMDFRELIAMNGIDNPNRIIVGRVLKVKPSGTANSAVASTTPIASDVVVARPIGNEPVIEKRPLGNTAETLKREPKGGKEPYSDQALSLAQGQGQPKPAEAAPPVAKGETKPAENAVTTDEVSWIWPANGKVIGTFSEGGSKGVDIAGKSGDSVVAVGDGKVLVANNALRGYGNMVVIKNTSSLFTVYAHNSKLLVKEGQNVTKGQKIAEMGNSDADQVKLHFEVRRQGKPVDPLKYLPER